MTIVVACFWIAAGWVAYAYLGYPVLLALLGWIRPQTVERAWIAPSLTVIVAVHNAAPRLREKLDELLAQDYPADRRQLLVADDASTDATPEIVADYVDSGVVHVRIRERGGKERAQREALSYAEGEIVAFTDVGTRLEPKGLSTIVRSFADPTVGCVSSTDRFVDEHGEPAGEGLYVKYEMLLRRLEAKAGSLVGLSGSFFAARRSVLGRFSDRLPSDFCALLETVRSGQRGVPDEDAHGCYTGAADPADEFSRKVRTVLRGLTAFFSAGDLLNPFKFPLFAWQLVSHKFVRWTVPFALIAVLGTSVLLAASGSMMFLVVLCLELSLYLCAALVHFVPQLGSNALTRTGHYFVIVNLAILVAWLRYLSGQRSISWTPTTR